MLDKKRKVALVTGTSGGTDREIAEILRVKGDDLLRVARSLEIVKRSRRNLDRLPVPT